MRISVYLSCSLCGTGHLTVSAVCAPIHVYLPSVSVLPRCTCLCTSIFYTTSGSKIDHDGRELRDPGQADPRRLSLRRGASWAARARARARRGQAQPCGDALELLGRKLIREPKPARHLGCRALRRRDAPPPRRSRVPILALQGRSTIPPPRAACRLRLTA